LSVENDYAEGQADALNNLGEIYTIKGDFNLSLKFYFASKKYYELIRNHKGIGKTLNNIAKVKNWQGKYDEAISLSFLAIRYFNSADHIYGVAKAYNTIGIAYDMNEQPDKAKQYYSKSFELFFGLDDFQGMANSLNNLAILYGKEGNLDKSLELFNQSLLINQKLNNLRLQTTILNNTGIIHKTQGRYLESELCFRESMQINRETGNTRGLMFSYLNLAGLYLERDHFPRSLEYFDKSIELAENLQSLPEMIECYEGYSKIYEETGNNLKALFYYKKFKEASDLLQKESVRVNIQKTEEKLILESKQSELELQKKDNEILKLQFEKSTWLKNFILGILISVLAILIMYIVQYRTKMKSNRYLAGLNSEMSDTNMKLVESESKLKELNATKDKFFSIISHDLRNPFASLVSFVRIMSRDADSMSQEEMNQLIAEMKNTIEKTQDLLENLLLWSKTQTGKILYQPGFFNVYEAVNENIQLFQSAFNQKQISVHVFIENPRMVYGDYNMIKTIIRNLLSNAIKFTNIKGNIKILAKDHEGNDIIIIEDDGVGMKQEEILLLFIPGGQKSKYGTADEKGSGIGLLICREFIEKHKGYFEVQSNPGKGSSFAMFLPKQKDINNK